MTSTQSKGLVAGGAGLTAIAAVLPWLEPSNSLQQMAQNSESGSQSISGIGIFTEGLQPLFSGPVAVGIAVVLVAVAFLAGGNRWADAGVIVGGGIVSLVAALWLLAPGTIMGGGMGASMVAAILSPGIGVYLTILGGVLILAGGARSYTSDDAAAATVPA